MAISQNFPNTRPSLNLNFARSRKLDSRITFTRGSTATYVDDAGLIRTAGINEARFDYDPITGESLGLLIEESRTNLLTFSEELDNSGAWTFAVGGSITANSIVSPDGTQDADVFIPNSGTSPEFLRNGSVTITADKDFVISGFFKPTGSTAGIDFRTSQTGSGFRIAVNLITGNVLAAEAIGVGVYRNSGVIPYPNGWYRVWVSGRHATGSTAGQWRVFRTDSSGNAVNGDGTSGVAIWGAQMESSSVDISFPTSYIPTVASTVTRSADNASITGTNFSDWYNSTEGTLFAAARINALGGGNFPGITYVDDGTANNCIGFYVNDFANDVIGAEAYISNVGQYQIVSPSAIVPNQLNKVITAYKVNDFAAAYSMGGSVGTDNSGSVPTVNRLIIGLLRGGNTPLNGTISQISYYPVRLTNAQLQDLTK